LDKREEYTNSIMDDIHKCAKDPYNNMKWLESDNPFQTLATMMEVSEAHLVIK
jgi:DNA-directed RNA polymerase